MKPTKQKQIDDFFSKVDSYFIENPDAQQILHNDGDCITIEILSSTSPSIAIELCSQVDIDYFDKGVAIRNRLQKVDNLTED